MGADVRDISILTASRDSGRKDQLPDEWTSSAFSVHTVYRNTSKKWPFAWVLESHTRNPGLQNRNGSSSLDHVRIRFESLTVRPSHIFAIPSSGQAASAFTHAAVDSGLVVAPASRRRDICLTVVYE